MAQVADWIAQSYESNSAPFNASRVVNMFAETSVPDAKSKSPVAIWGAPGTAPFCDLGLLGDPGPVLGFTFMQGLVYAVTGQAFYRIGHDGVAHYLGATTPSSGGISIDNNGQTIVWVDGFSGWVYNASFGVKPITDPNFLPGFSVAFFDLYFVFSQRATRTFFLSPLNWDGNTAFDGTLYSNKEATPDNLVAIANSHEQLYLMGEKRIEVWYDAANQPPSFPLSRSDGAIIQRGIIAPYGWCIEDNTMFFLGDDLVFYRLANSFVPERMSNHGVESQWYRYTGHRMTRCFSYTLFGHKLIVLLFPPAKKTWVLDLATRRWHERESWLDGNEDSSIGRWRVNCAMVNSSSIEMYPEILVGDSLSGRIDQVNPDTFTEFGAVQRAMIIAPPIASDRKRVFMKRFEIDIESGVGVPAPGNYGEFYLPTGVIMPTNSFIDTAGALANNPALFYSFLFSHFVYVPSGTGFVLGHGFGNQPGTGPGLQISVFSSSNQITVKAWDASGSPIVVASFQWLSWARWLWIGIACDTQHQKLEVWVNDTTGDQQAAPISVVWSSRNPIPNAAGQPWFLAPAQSTTVADLYFSPTAGFIDLANSGKRRLFEDASGNGMYLGPSAVYPSGVRPAVYLQAFTGNANRFAQNVDGNGGAFNITGTLSTVPFAQGPGATTVTTQFPAPQGGDPQVLLSVSDDGGRTWSVMKKERSIGKLGEYLKRVRWMKMGHFRQRLIKLEVTDPVRRNIVGVYMDLTQGLD